MKQDLFTEKVRIEDNSVVIKKHIKDIEGGRTLDCTGYTAEIIHAGHVIIKVGGTYKPMPVTVTGDAYASLPDGATYVGILYSSITTKKPAASIMTWGVVNEEALPFAVTAIKSAFLSACPHIEFTKDEEA